MDRRTRSGGKDTGPGLFDTVSPAPEAEKKLATKAAKASNPKPAPPAEPVSPADSEDTADPGTLTVTQLTEEIQGRMKSFGRVRVEGELSGVKRAASGHVYFELKDEGARISCAVWRSQVRRALSFDPEEGLSVVAHGKLDVYAPRGSYSLIIEKLELQGIGALLAKLEELKRELGALGWFERARPLPAMPRCIGVVTSRDTAALRDFLRTRSMRWPGYPMRLCHTPVQGPGAAAEIAKAIDALDRSGVDVIVVTRGGGSLEDLWAFNERPVAEAIRRASVPVVSGVGHETDVSLADFVADHRAHTPTDAAQTVIPDRGALLERLQRQGNFLLAAMDGLLADRAGRLERLSARPVLRSADWILADRGRELDGLVRRLQLASEAQGRSRAQRLSDLATRLERESPRARIERRSSRLATAGTRLLAAGGDALEKSERRFELCRANLESRSPLKIMRRGYSMTRRAGDVAAVRDASDLKVGDEIETVFARGRVRSSVLDVRLSAE